MLVNTSYWGFLFENLYLDSLKFSIYADASSATNYGLSSQLGYLVLRCDSMYLCHLLDFASKK